MKEPEDGYCCTNQPMFSVQDDDGDTVGYLCAKCKTFYKWFLIAQDDEED
jgi:hypothetical protein